MGKKIERIVAAADCETDPFKEGRTQFSPCSWGILFDGKYHEFWGDDATEQFLAFLEDDDTPPLEIYAHNGGKFDWLFLKDRFDENVSLINGRVARVTIMNGRHELRDSYLNMPVPLRLFQTQSGEKAEFDYAKLERGVRDRYHKEILSYQKQDIVVLYEAVVAWHEMFGRKFLTMASAATHLLRESIEEEYGDDLETLNETKDEFFRQFYFGGRVECFRAGIIDRPLYVYDINSSYPATMRNLDHPISNTYRESKTLTDKTDFAIVVAWSRGALPLRKENGGIHFPHGLYTFHATGHEIRKARELGVLNVIEVKWACEFTKRGHFQAFIDRFFGLRQVAKKEKNGLYDLFYKLVMNSSYGKTAIDPRKFTDNMILEGDDLPEPSESMTAHLDAWEAATTEDAKRAASYSVWSKTEQLEDGRWLWEKKLDPRGKFLNVATGASITGGSRANMLQGLHDAVGAVYCDTDSVFCEGFTGDVDAKRLGAWDMEAYLPEGAAIAGKKMYAGKYITKDGELKWKKASKGVDLTPEQIISVAQGNTVKHTSQAPTFSLSGVSTITREIKQTAYIEPKG